MVGLEFRERLNGGEYHGCDEVLRGRDLPTPQRVGEEYYVPQPYVLQLGLRGFRWVVAKQPVHQIGVVMLGDAALVQFCTGFGNVVDDMS